MSGIYIHIPFCNKRCNYCDFYLVTNLNAIDRFLCNLKNEIFLSSTFFKKETFDTIYFGGGTPSLLSHIQIEDILNYLHTYFNIDKKAEVSMESNPENFLKKNFYDYKIAGINRISIGAQSFLDSELKFLTRQHSSIDIENVITKAKVYFDNINLDIIYSLPSQTIKDIDFSLSKAIELEINHISAYTLTFEEKTVLFKSLKKNVVKKNPDSLEAEFYNFVSDKLSSNGYKHYEISNFAKDGYQCNHNLKYWRYENYIGFGPSSHSMFNYERWHNSKNLTEYNLILEENKLPVQQKYKLTAQQKNLEFIMLSLRSNGLNLKKYENLFKKDFRKEFSSSINELIKNNYAFNSQENFKLNNRGYLIADEIIAKYF